MDWPPRYAFRKRTLASPAEISRQLARPHATRLSGSVRGSKFHKLPPELPNLTKSCCRVSFQETLSGRGEFLYELHNRFGQRSPTFPVASSAVIATLMQEGPRRTPREALPHSSLPQASSVSLQLPCRTSLFLHGANHIQRP